MSSLILQSAFYKFEPKRYGEKVACKTFLLICRGKIGNKAPLFQEEGYVKIKQALPHVNVHYTDVNHYELVFNKQEEIVEQIKQFLD